MSEEPTAEQAEAEQLIDEFINDPRPAKQWFTLTGLAGTGKTHVLSRIAKRYPKAILCAPFGRTASMLTRRTGLHCSTLHSAIYYFKGETLDAQGRKQLEFINRVDSRGWTGMLCFLDESGVVDVQLAQDLLSTGCRVVATGDPGQLPPVRGDRFFTEPDFTLHEVQRQALESPIIRQAYTARHHGRYQADGDDFRVERFVDRPDILSADIFLCWTNSMRRKMNDLKRAHLELANAPPQAGEPIMCLKNNHKLGLMNGAIYTLLETINLDPQFRRIVIENDDGEEVELRHTWFEDMYFSDHKLDTPFAFAYASTVHKMIGSEAPRIIMIDDYTQSKDRNEWLYTGITRAQQSIIIQRG